MDVKDSLTFRRAASSAISEYKMLEGMILSDLIEGNHAFSDTALEIMRIQFANWFPWALRVERLLENKGVDNAAERIIHMVDVTSERYIKAVVDRSNPVHRAWEELHKRIVLKYLKDKIPMAMVDTQATAFTHILSLLSECMNYMLFEMHELDSIAHNYDPKSHKLVSFFETEVKGRIEKHIDRRTAPTTPFLSVDNMSVRYYEMYGVSPVSIRFDLYRKYLNFDPSEIEIKAYVNTAHAHLRELAEEPLGSNGVTITGIV